MKSERLDMARWTDADADADGTEERTDEELTTVKLVINLVQELADKCRSIEEFREALKKAVEENDEKK